MGGREGEKERGREMFVRCELGGGGMIYHVCMSVRVP